MNTDLAHAKLVHSVQWTVEATRDAESPLTAQALRYALTCQLQALCALRGVSFKPAMTFNVSHAKTTGVYYALMECGLLDAANLTVVLGSDCFTDAPRDEEED